MMKEFVCKECGKYFKIPLWRFKQKGKRVYCSNHCRLEAMKGKKNWSWKGGVWSKYKKPIYWFIAAEHYPIKCTKCEASKANALVVHHIDLDRKNNNYENLMFLCKSCHAKEHEFYRNFSGSPSRHKTEESLTSINCENPERWFPKTTLNKMRDQEGL